MQTLRYWDYYGMTETFTDLYDSSTKQEPFKHLYDMITSRENILLAYRTIKPNKGSKTAGTDGKTIIDIEKRSVFLQVGGGQYNGRDQVPRAHTSYPGYLKNNL